MTPVRARRGDMRRLPRGSLRVNRGPVTIVRADGRGCVGYSVSKSVGNAVSRNRVRRRLREATRLAIDPGLLAATHLVIGRRGVLDVEFTELENCLRSGFQELHERSRPTRSPK